MLLKTKFVFAQVAAFIATVVDFATTISFRELIGVHYMTAVCSGAICGATTAFVLNRYWVFKSRQSKIIFQALKYTLALSGSILLNTAGTFFLTETFHLPYLLSKTLMSITVGFTYSFFVAKTFVFV